MMKGGTEVAVLLRRALLTIVAGIEKRYELKQRSETGCLAPTRPRSVIR